LPALLRCRRAVLLDLSKCMFLVLSHVRRLERFVQTPDLCPVTVALEPSLLARPHSHWPIRPVPAIVVFVALHVVDVLLLVFLLALLRKLISTLIRPLTYRQ